MAAVLAVLLTPLAAVADTSLVIDVTVHRSADFDAERVMVSAFRSESGGWQTYASEVVDLDADSVQVRLEVPASGDYRVCAQDPANVYVMTCLGGGTSPGDDRNQLVQVVDGSASVELEMRVPTSISGTVTDDLGVPIEGAEVTIIRSGGGTRVATDTGPDGDYRVPVNPGSYVVGFEADGHVSEYYSQDADDVTDPDLATPVTPEEEAPAEHVDAELDRLATISGQVTTDGLTEDEVAGLTVVAFDGDDEEVVRDEELVEVAGGADYTLRDLEAGTYRVCVAESAAVVLTCREGIAVAPPEQLTGIALAPTVKGRVVGTVIGAEDEPLAGVRVTAYAGDDWSAARSVVTDAGGGYALRLSAGDYRIGFSGGGHQREYYLDSATLDGATTLTVADESDTPAEDARLAPGATISGFFSGPSGSDLDGIRVVAYAAGPGGWHEVAEAEDLSAGSYAVEGLPVGTYRICAVVDGVAWRPGCVGGLSVGDATDIVLDEPVLSSGHDLTLVSAASSVILTDLSVGGTPVVGETLTVSATVSPANATVTWTWRRGSTPVGTGTSYVVKPADVDATLRVEGKATAPSMASWEGLAAETGPVTKAVFTAAPAPAISGASGPSSAPRVGDTLTAVTGAWSPAPDAFAYEWLVGGESAGSAASYRVGPGDENRPITVRVLGTRAGYVDPDWLESAATPAVLPAPVLEAVRPAGIAGMPVVGGRLSATPATWSPADVAATYEWRLGTAVIGTGAEITVPVAAQGARLQLVVTGSRAGSAPVTLAPVTSQVVAPGRIGLLAAGKIKGKAKAGKKLKYVAERTSPVAATRSYQWLRNGKPIKKATKATYKLTKKDRRKRISLRVTLGATGYQPLVVTTAAVKVKK